MRFNELLEKSMPDLIRDLQGCIRIPSVYQADDSEIVSEGYSIDDVPVEELGADLGYGDAADDMDFDNEEDM